MVSYEPWEADNEFYNRGVGLVGSAARCYILSGHNCYLEIYQYDSPTRIGPQPAGLGAHELGIRHLSFFVDDVWKEWSRLQSLGGKAMNEPVGNEEFGWATYCRDPFGNIIELCTYGGSRDKLTRLPAVDFENDFEGRA